MFERETPPGNNPPVETKAAIPKIKMQTVMRTRPLDRGYNYEYNAFKRLDEKLKDGWIVVMCNKVGEELEYILEK
ncbi:MAG: hypothetical protein J6F30_08240 [Cellulosilyticum sp.]|nr:hypothetical protein [Cellulosilyticum sp.]